MRTPAGALLLASALGCAGRLPSPVPAHADYAARRWPGSDLNSLERGRRLYVARCTRCHHAYVPGDYSAKEWPQVMTEMEKETELSPDERESMLRYLITIIEANVPPRDTPR